MADGCVIEVDDPALGPVRQVGRVYELHACPTAAPTAPPAIGADTDAVRAEADAVAAARAGDAVLDRGTVVAVGRGARARPRAGGRRAVGHP